MQTQWDVIIIGGGPAGLSAALTLVRARRSVLVIDAGEQRNRFAPHMHGVLGHDGKSPLQLVADGRREVEGYGGVLLEGDVARAAVASGGFTVATTAGLELHATRLIVASGIRDELPDIPGVQQLWGTGVVVCPYCDGYEHRDQRIGVIATGPMGVHQAQLLRGWSSDVTFLTHTSQLTPDEVVALEARGIVVRSGVVAEVHSTDGQLRSVELPGGERVELDVVFTGTTMHPRDEIARSLGAVGEGQFVDSDAFGATSVPGLWVAGNVADPKANVPVALGAGALVGAMVNADLTTDAIARAVAALPAAG